MRGDCHEVKQAGIFGGLIGTLRKALSARLPAAERYREHDATYLRETAHIPTEISVQAHCAPMHFQSELQFFASAATLASFSVSLSLAKVSGQPPQQK